MMPKRVDDAPHAPPVLIVDGPDFGAAGGDGLGEGGVGVGDRKDHPHRTAAKRFGTVVGVLGGFIGEPELGALDREPGDDFAIGAFDLVGDFGAESGLVEGDRLFPAADREHGGDRG